ncbi:MAG: recombinase RecT [Parasutterella sp.]
MSTSDQLAAAVGAPSAPVAKPKTKAPAIVQQVLSDQFKNSSALAVPKHLSADRMARIAATELRKTPDLLDTTPASFMGAVMQSAQLGLEPGSALGQAYLVPFNKKDQKTGKWYKECQLILGYRGMIDLARRSGQVLSLSAFAVHEGDDFSYQLGLHPDIHHVPSCDAGRIKKPIIFVYAVAKSERRWVSV